MAGGNIPYMGYAEVNLKILEIRAFNEDVLMLVIEDSPYTQRVRIQLGALHIIRALELVSKSDMLIFSSKWRRGRLVTLLATKSAKAGMENSKAFTLDHVKGGIKLTKAVEIPTFETLHVQGLSKVRGHQHCVNTITEAPNEEYLNSIATVMSYTCLKPGSGCVAIGLHNLTGKNIILKPNTVIVKISAANVVPHMLASKNPVGTRSKQATAHPNELCNRIKLNTHSDNLKQGHSTNDAPPYKKTPLSSEKLTKLFEKNRSEQYSR